MTRLPTVTLQQFLARQGYDPGPTDGIFGQRTREALHDYIEAHKGDGPPDLAQALDRFDSLSDAARWPGCCKGITLGRGYDLGHADHAQIDEDFKDAPEEQRAKLKQAAGVQGHAAAEMSFHLGGFSLIADLERHLFWHRTVPRLERECEGIWPGFEKLPPRTKVALLCLYYHRGGGMDGHSRSEMRTIKDLVQEPDLAGIALEILSMSRLWANSPVYDDMERARQMEADLVIEDLLLTDFDPERNGFADSI